MAKVIITIEDIQNDDGRQGVNAQCQFDPQITTFAQMSPAQMLGAALSQHIAQILTGAGAEVTTQVRRIPAGEDGEIESGIAGQLQTAPATASELVN